MAASDHCNRSDRTMVYILRGPHGTQFVRGTCLHHAPGGGAEVKRGEDIVLFMNPNGSFISEEQKEFRDKRVEC